MDLINNLDEKNNLKEYTDIDKNDLNQENKEKDTQSKIYKSGKENIINEKNTNISSENKKKNSSSDFKQKDFEFNFSNKDKNQSKCSLNIKNNKICLDEFL